jgi:hypothetical protein
MFSPVTNLKRNSISWKTRKKMLNKLIGALSVVALVGFASDAPALAHGGFGGGGFGGGMHAGGFGGGMHGGGFHSGAFGGMHAGGFGMGPGPAGVRGGGFGIGPGPAEIHSGGPQGSSSDSSSWNGHYWGHDRDHGWHHDHDHDHDHDHHHHHDWDDGGYYFGDTDFDSDVEFYDDGGTDDYAASPQDDGYWYYCTDSQSYYPYVTTCASQWERVLPNATTPSDSGQ